MMPYSLIYVTTSSIEEAKAIANTLVEERIVACANIIPKVISYYRWEGRIRQEEEALVFLKTERRSVEQAIRKIGELHSYKVPGISVLEIKTGDPDFLKWISEEVTGS